MSQPTLSRLENAPSWRELARMGLTMIDLFCDSFERVPQRIVLDIDDTPDAVHGGQQLALFNAHYDEYAHASIHNHFNQERHLYNRGSFKLNRSAALAEWRQLAV